jgi:hypothetical protein
LIASQRQSRFTGGAKKQKHQMLILEIKVSMQIFTCQYFELSDADNSAKQALN